MSASVVRPAGSGTVRDPFVHQGFFYRGADEYLTGTLDFVAAGLAAGEPVLVAVPGPGLALLRPALAAHTGRVRLVDMAVAGRNPGRIIPGVLYAFAAEHAPRRVRIVGEPVWFGRSTTEYPACVQHEALINTVFAGRELSILCPYDAARLEPAVLADAARTHPVLRQGGACRPSRHYDGPEPVVADFNRPLPGPAAEVATLIFDGDGLAPVRRFVAEHARRAGLDDDRTADLQIAVNEVAANTIDHSGGPGTLRIWTEGPSLICEISDSGRLTDPLAGRVPPLPGTERGRGLVLVNFLCDLVRMYTTGAGTTVRLHMLI